MAGMYGINSLYSGLFGSGSSGSNSLFSSFYSNLGQYASVKSGAYAKAAKAYYSKSSTVTGDDNPIKSTNKTDRTSVTSYKTDTSKELEKTTSATTKTAYSKTNKDNVALNTVKTEASELTTATKKLLDTGKDSVFAQDKEYDKDAAYEAVNDFVKEYNDTVTALGGTGNTAVNTVGDSMKRMTRAMSDSLSKVGVTVGTDGKLSVDEDAFKSADESKVRSMFNGSGSISGIVSSSSSRIEQQAANQISKLDTANNDNDKKDTTNKTTTFNNSTYNDSGSYYNYYNSGLLYNGYF